MSKVTVEICCGTSCYLLGAAQLQELDSDLPAAWAERVEIVSRPCLNLCETENLGRAPFVRINGKEILCEATVDKLKNRISEILAAEEVLI